MKNFGGVSASHHLKSADLNSKLRLLNRFGYREFNGLRSTREYLFFTRPDCNLLDLSNGGLSTGLDNDPYFVDLYMRQPEVFSHLQKSIPEEGGPYMNLLCNSVRNKLDLPGISASEIETSKTNFGTSISFRKHSFQSDESHEFNLDFEDDKSLMIYNIFKAWDLYGNLKSIGMVEPRDIYRDNREIHDQISIYKFIVDETNYNILFYAKLFGCYPKGVPRDHFSELDTSLTYSIPFKANFVEELNPMIIAEFNHLTKNANAQESPLYNVETGETGANWATTAYVEKYMYKNKKGYGYRLKWRL